MRYKEELETFLAYAWSEEAELYYNGYVYFYGGGYFTNEEGQRKYRFHLVTFKAILKDDINCEPVWTDNYERIVDWNPFYNLVADNPEEIREKVFSEKFFEGKTFWEVENEVLWVDVCYWNERSIRETREEVRKRKEEERQKEENKNLNQ